MQEKLFAQFAKLDILFQVVLVSLVILAAYLVMEQQQLLVHHACWGRPLLLRILASAIQFSVLNAILIPLIVLTAFIPLREIS